jgi:Leucine-rich repeat (LRR) protein
VSRNRLERLPQALVELEALQLLDASHNRLVDFAGPSLRGLASLVKVDLSNNQLQLLGAEIGCLSSLAELDISNNALRELPEELCAVPLRTLRAGVNQLAALPHSLGRLACLEELECGQNQLTTLPESIGFCVALARIDARQNRLSSVPASITGCVALRELYLGINELTAAKVPPLGSGGALTALTILDLSDNDLRSAVAAVGLKALERLDLRNNELSTLEPELGLLPALKWVGLDGNPLRALRRELCAGPASELLKFLRTRLDEEAELAAEPWSAGSPFGSIVREAAASGVLELNSAEVSDDLLPEGCLALPGLPLLEQLEIPGIEDH